MTFSCESDIVHHGDSCEISCSHAFRNLEAVEHTISCTDRVLHTDLVCAQDCDLGPLLVSPGTQGLGTCTGSSIPHGAACTPACAVGFTATASALTCTGGLVSPFECAPSTCNPAVDGVVALPLHATASTCIGVLEHGADCSIDCASGYLPSSGGTTATCRNGVTVAADGFECAPLTDLISHELDFRRCTGDVIDSRDRAIVVSFLG